MPDLKTDPVEHFAAIVHEIAASAQRQIDVATADAKADLEEAAKVIQQLGGIELSKATVVIGSIVEIGDYTDSTGRDSEQRLSNVSFYGPGGKQHHLMVCQSYCDPARPLLPAGKYTALFVLTPIKE